MWVLLPSSSVGKQSQLLLQPTEVELGLQVGVEFDKIQSGLKRSAVFIVKWKVLEPPFCVQILQYPNLCFQIILLNRTTEE